MTTLRAVFGSTYNDLDAEQRRALELDVRAMCDKEDFNTEQEAAIELRKRIGGPVNLLSYARCIVTNYR